MKITKNFDSHEMRCKHCGVSDCSMELYEALQELRDKIGKPITVNSAYRCKEHNDAVGSNDRSQHLRGKAADIVVNGMTPEEVKFAALGVPLFVDGGIGIYDTFVHVDVRGRRARWDKRSV